MNIVVAMKQIPDLRQIRIRNRQPVWDDVPLTFGNIDRNALEAGVQLKEHLGGKVTVISAGTESLEETIKEALAAGADEAYLVADDKLENMASTLSAQLLAEAVQNLSDTDMIIFGEGSGDNYSGQVGSRTAQILGWPQVAYVSSIQMEGNTAQVTRVLEDGEETLSVSLPAVLMVMADINEPRIPSVTQILKAGKKPKEILTLDDMNLEPVKAKIATISDLAPEMKRKQVQIKTADELIQVLETEGFIRR